MSHPPLEFQWKETRETEFRELLRKLGERTRDGLFNADYLKYTKQHAETGQRGFLCITFDNVNVMHEWLDSKGEYDSNIAYLPAEMGDSIPQLKLRLQTHDPTRTLILLFQIIIRKDDKEIEMESILTSVEQSKN